MEAGYAGIRPAHTARKKAKQYNEGSDDGGRSHGGRHRGLLSLLQLLQ